MQLHFFGRSLKFTTKRIRSQYRICYSVTALGGKKELAFLRHSRIRWKIETPGSKLSPARALFLHYCESAGFNLFPSTAMPRRVQTDWSISSSHQGSGKGQKVFLSNQTARSVLNACEGSSDLMYVVSLQWSNCKGYTVEKEKRRKFLYENKYHFCKSFFCIRMFKQEQLIY